MRDIKPELRLSSIVLIGSFNPLIFHPLWFSKEGLISPSEGPEAKIQIIHQQITQFDLDWLRLEVTRERFNAGTQQEPNDPVLRDLVVGTFEILSHTPITQMGINLLMHFDLGEKERWETGTNNFAPITYWKDILKNAKFRSITEQEEPRRDGLKGYINVKIEPSLKLMSEGKTGIYFDINDHFQVENPDTTIGSEEIIGILKEKWQESYDRSNQIIYSLLERI